MSLEQQVIRKVRIRVVYFVFILYVLFSLDRANISFAALRMNHDLGFDATTYGFGVSVFYISYLLFQVPFSMMINRFGARAWFVVSLLIWGAASAGLAFASGPKVFYALRFLLGIGEAGFGTTVVFFLSSWFPNRYRGGAISFTYLAAPVSVIIGAPLSGWLLSFQGAGLAGWQWMFLLEGLPAVALGLVAVSAIANSPMEAKWLDAAERSWLVEQLASDRRKVSESGSMSAFGKIAASGRVWAAAAALFSLILGLTGLLYWLPLVIEELSGTTDVMTGALTSLPWVAMLVGMYFNGRHSDRSQERIWHIGMGMLSAAVGLTIAASAPAPYNLLGVMLAGFGIGAAQGIFWTVPLGFLSGTGITGGIAFINIIGNGAGLAGPNLIAWLRLHTGSFSAPAYVLAGCLALGFVLLKLANMPASRERADQPSARIGIDDRAHT